MVINDINSLRKRIRGSNPLIHCITNPISINQCANAILAVGGRPMMAEHPEEAAEITATAGALMINFGNITDVRMKSMLISAEYAYKNNIPFIADLVGLACSTLRKNYTDKLLSAVTPTVVKGNYSEINALYNSSYCSSGVDADISLTSDYICHISHELANKYGFTVLASGENDIIADKDVVYVVSNGTPQLASVTGTGCMLGALCGCYLAEGSGAEAAVAAAAVLGISGELAETNKGNGSFMTGLMDNISVLSDEKLTEMLKMEEKRIEY